MKMMMDEGLISKERGWGGDGSGTGSDDGETVIVELAKDVFGIVETSTLEPYRDVVHRNRLINHLTNIHDTYRSRIFIHSRKEPTCW